MEVRWHKDPQAEEQMQKFGISFEYQDQVPISSLKASQSIYENHRFGQTINEDHLNMMIYAMKDGNSFPAVVIGPTPTSNGVGGYCLGGNHRTKSAIAVGAKFVAAYVIKAIDQTQYDLFTRANNINHGLNHTEEEKILFCLRIHKKNDISLNELNKIFFANNERTFQRLVDAEKAEQVTETLGKHHMRVDANSNLTGVHLTALHAVKDENLLTKTAQLIEARPHMAITEVKDIIKRVNKDPSNGAAYIQEMAKALTHRSKTGALPEEADFKRKTNAYIEYLTTGHKKGQPFPKAKEFASAKGAKEISAMLSVLINLAKTVK